MFPAGKHLPDLQTLDLSCADHDLARDFAVDAECMESIISGCPQLRYLDLTNVLEAGACDVLQQLAQSCLELRLGGPKITDATTAVLAQLTQLTELRLWICPELTDVGMLQLTALTRLSTLMAQC